MNEDIWFPERSTPVTNETTPDPEAETPAPDDAPGDPGTDPAVETEQAVEDTTPLTSEADDVTPEEDVPTA